MAKYSSDTVLDDALNEIATATVMTLCTQEPTTRDEAVNTYALASGTPTFTGPADSATSGRQITVDQLAGVTVDTDGDATHVALCDASDLLYVTTCTSQTVTAGNQVTFDAWTVTISDPV